LRSQFQGDLRTRAPVVLQLSLVTVPAGVLAQRKCLLITQIDPADVSELQNMHDLSRGTSQDLTQNADETVHPQVTPDASTHDASTSLELELLDNFC